MRAKIWERIQNSVKPASYRFEKIVQSIKSSRRDMFPGSRRYFQSRPRRSTLLPLHVFLTRLDLDHCTLKRIQVRYSRESFIAVLVVVEMDLGV